MFFPVLGLSAAAIALVQLGAMSVWIVVLKAFLALALAVALLLSLGHVWRWHKDSQAK